MSTAAAVAIVAGTAVSIDASNKASSAAKEKGRVMSASQRIEDAATMRKQAREARIQRARIAQASENIGTGGSSQELGAQSSLSSQVGANTARIGGQQLVAEGITSLNKDIASAQTQGAIGQGISSLGSTAFSATGGFDNLFGG